MCVWNYLTGFTDKRQLFIAESTANATVHWAFDVAASKNMKERPEERDIEWVAAGLVGAAPGS